MKFIKSLMLVATVASLCVSCGGPGPMTKEEYSQKVTEISKAVMNQEITQEEATKQMTELAKELQSRGVK